MTVMAPPPVNAAAADAAGVAAAKPVGFLKGLQNAASSPQLLTGLVQGVGSAYQGSQARAEARDARDAETARRERLAKVGGAGWKQTFRTA